nr:hypothetical protein [uncultured Comamonas sp.]
MKLPQHDAGQYAAALRALLPPGQAWQWPTGGLGDSMLQGTAQELARVGAHGQEVLDAAIEAHRPKAGSWHIDEYRRVANKALDGLQEPTRRAFTVGSKTGQRLWSGASATLNFPIDLVQVSHLVGPMRVGSKAGDRLWGARGRYVLLVRYYRTVADPKAIWAALDAFKQAHVYLWFEDISGVGGSYAPN